MALESRFKTRFNNETTAYLDLMCFQPWTYVFVWYCERFESSIFFPTSHQWTKQLCCTVNIHKWTVSDFLQPHWHAHWQRENILLKWHFQTANDTQLITYWGMIHQKFQTARSQVDILFSPIKNIVKSCCSIFPHQSVVIVSYHSVKRVRTTNTFQFEVGVCCIFVTFVHSSFFIQYLNVFSYRKTPSTFISMQCFSSFLAVVSGSGMVYLQYI